MVLFVYGLMGKWLIAIMITALTVTYFIFKGLDEAGVIKGAEDVVFKVFNDTKSIAQHCTPLITNLNDFWYCIEHPPTYTPSEEEAALRSGALNLIAPEENSNDIKDPYAE